jgi:predicted RNA binding protein YcfA (HicA-like mRNA interferase family)
MGGNFRPLPTKCVENLLKHLGYTYKRTTASHDQWVKNGHRTIPLWGNEKQIPAMHLKTICKNTNFTLDDIYKWADENC